MHLLNVRSPFLLQEVLHTISAPSGQVQRIVIFKKNGVQAMVEYPFSINFIFLYAAFVARSMVIRVNTTPEVFTARKSLLRKLTL